MKYMDDYLLRVVRQFMAILTIPFMSLNSFMVNQKGNVFYHEGMKPASAGTLRFFGGIFYCDSYAVFSDLHNTIPFMSLISFMVNQKGNVFYHEGMKPASAGTLRIWWGLVQSLPGVRESK